MRALAVLLLTAGVASAAPELSAQSAIAIDATTGEAIFEKRADDVRPIASMTKLFVALSLRKHHVDLAKSSTINFDDAKSGIGGAHTILLEGETFANADLFAAMMLVSDNRVPSALARSVGMSLDELVTDMHHIAKDLGLAKTHFDDATGIAGNASTAREMALALRAALRDPVIARYAATRYAKIESVSKRISSEYRSTVGPLFDKRFKIVGGKTGHTDAAGYCMIVEAKLGERTIAFALLGAASREASYDDFAKLAAFVSH